MIRSIIISTKLDMGFIFIIIGLSTMWLFMFKIEWLFDSKSFRINILYNVCLFLLYFLFDYYEIGNPKYIIALRIPLMSSIVFLIFYQIFKSIYHRNPENTAWAMTGKPMEDVVFSILFWVFGVGLSSMFLL